MHNIYVWSTARTSSGKAFYSPPRSHLRETLQDTSTRYRGVENTLVGR